ncbi:MAG: Gfo/Idh/MocA family protein [Oceanipulchritudo sp.]
MSDQEPRIGIIGCGVIAPAHIESYGGLPGVRVVALCDLKPERMQAIRDKYPDLDAACFERYGDLLASGAVDAVSVCTDHASHEEISLAALKAGRHVLCEKALTISTESLERMLAAAGQAPRLVAAGILQHRFDPIFRALKGILEEGLLGQILTTSLQHNCLRTEAYYREDGWRGTWAGEGGSLLINQSIHFLDIQQWLMGGAASVQAHTANLAHQGIIETEDTAAVSLSFRNGALGTFAATSASHQNWNHAFQIVGTEGELRLRDGQLTDCFHKDPDLEERIARRLNIEEREGVEGAKVYYGSSHPAQIRDFIEAIREGHRPFVGFSEAAEPVRLVLGIYESSRSGKRVDFQETTARMENSTTNHPNSANRKDF